MPQYNYVFVRTDIPLSDQVVQVAHVCLLAGKKFPANDKDHLVLLSLKDSKDLLKVRYLLEEACIAYEVFYEPDDEMGFTAICTELISGNKRKLFKNFELW